MNINLIEGLWDWLKSSVINNVFSFIENIINKVNFVIVKHLSLIKNKIY